MKIALIRCNPGGGPRETNVTGSYHPLGLLYIGAQLKRKGFDKLRIIDAEAIKLNSDAVLGQISPDTSLIGFTSTTLSWPAVREISVKAKQRFADSILVVGGPHVTAFPAESLEASSFDIGVIGDGENILVDIAQRLGAQKSLSGIPGCVERANGKSKINLPVQWIEDLDTVPFPEFGLLGFIHYRSVMVKEPFCSIITSRGCPFRCKFCSQIYSGDILRSRSPQNIVDEIEYNIKEHHIKEMIFFDETFGVRNGDANEMCFLILKRKLKFRWNARTRIDVLNKELLQNMKKAGCYALHLGVESGTQRILDEMGKNIELREIVETIRLCREIGFRIHAYFMIGYPGETRNEINSTIRFSKKLNLNWASYTITVPNPRTHLYRFALDKGYLKSDYWQDYTMGKITKAIPFFESENISSAYLKRAKKWAYFSFYIRPVILLDNFLFFYKSGGFRRLPLSIYLWLKEIIG